LSRITAHETRKVVERAKGILQRDLGISEQEAYLTIQKQSRQRRRPKREIADAILLADDLRRGRNPSQVGFCLPVAGALVGYSPRGRLSLPSGAAFRRKGGAAAATVPDQFTVCVTSAVLPL
jgi:hypothetical protein